MTPSARRCAALATLATLTTALLPLTALPSLAATEPVAAPLAAPVSLSPDDSAAAYPHTALQTVRLNWAPVAGASGYRVQVGRDATWSNDPVLTQDVVTSEFTLPVALPYASYVWRVAALKGSLVGHWTSESSQPQADAEFTRGWRTAPVTLTPSGLVGGRPEFAWTPVANASAYEVQVSSKEFADGGQGQPVGPVDTCYTVRSRVTFFTEHVQHAEDNAGPCTSTLLGSGAPLHWRVRALDRFVDAATDGSTSPATAAGISDLPPSGAPDASIPANCPGDTGGGCDPTHPVAAGSWSPVVDLTSTGVAPVGTYDPTVLVPTASVASDPDNLCTLDTTPTAPAERATCVDFPTLRWTPAPGASRYRVTVALDDAFTNIQRIVDTAGLSWTPTDAWADSGASGSYFYAVQACDVSGCGDKSPTPASFRKVTPRPTLGTKPGSTGEFTLSWQSYAAALAAKTGQAPSLDAYAYHVQVASSDHPAFDVVVDDAIVDQASYTSAKKLYGDGSFVWRVQPLDPSAHKLPWSLSQAFTRDSTPPRLLSVSPSSRVAVNQRLTLAFSEPVTGLSSSSVTLSPAAPATLTVTGNSTATLTPTKPLLPGATYTVVVASTVKDLAGNSALAAGPVLTVNPLVDDASPALTYSSGWSVLSSSNAVGGRYHAAAPTATFHPSAALAFRGTGVALTACLAPANGYVDVLVDNVRKARVSTYRSFSGCGVRVATVTGLVRGLHTIKVVGLGSHVSASKGNAIGVDALTVTP